MPDDIEGPRVEVIVDLRRVAAAFEAIARQLGQVGADVFEALRETAAAVPAALDHQPVSDPREHALEARRNRNTGPPRRDRPPRRVDPRGGLYR